MLILTFLYLCKRFNVAERLKLKKVLVKVYKPAAGQPNMEYLIK